MKLSKAYSILGIDQTATTEEIDRAYRSKAKDLHPDLNRDRDTTNEFQELQEAIETVRSHRTTGNGSHSDEQERADFASATPFDLLAYIRGFMSTHRIVVLYDGTLMQHHGENSQHSARRVEEELLRQDIDVKWLMDGMTVDLHMVGEKVSGRLLGASLNNELRARHAVRRKDIAEPLLNSLKTDERETGWHALKALCRIVFDNDEDIAARCLAHFIWQVKRKLINMTVTNHMMIVVYGPVQGSGKTHFVERFLKPIQELAVGPVALSYISDHRAGDIFRQYVLFVDDIDPVKQDQTAALKSLMTNSKVTRRKLGTSMNTTLQQRATLIGTTNHPIEHLVPDTSGHRRFVTLNFRNGSKARGGDEAVWQAVKDADYEAIWRAIDQQAESPITSVLDDLARYQDSKRHHSPLEQWLFELDVHSADVVELTTQYGIPAQKLWELFRNQTGSSMTDTGFGREMSELVKSAGCPFAPRVEAQTGRRFYPIRDRSLDRRPTLQ